MYNFQYPNQNQYRQMTMYGQQQDLYRQNSMFGLQGRMIDNEELAKVIEIPLDGSISYFPLADGNTIIAKQLQQDGTSKTMTYRLVNDENGSNFKKYVTLEEFNEAINKIGNNGFKDEIKGIKRQVKDLIEDLDEIKNKKG